ncbi:hypothetical protein B0H17DRAFT_514234 [Mycena rosella]|uniref:Uncharacterized protein n=1 Tax=Mycena rosella TaxID=1033263 RepID=A0AAD7BVJ2_MYCRO|nr:hypothetical protein B0H17DRAFT_514234 [Mycena rosella]
MCAIMEIISMLTTFLRSSLPSPRPVNPLSAAPLRHALRRDHPRNAHPAAPHAHRLVCALPRRAGVFELRGLCVGRTSGDASRARDVRRLRAVCDRVPAACDMVRGVRQGVYPARTSFRHSFLLAFFHDRARAPRPTLHRTSTPTRARSLARPAPLLPTCWLAAASLWAITASPWTALQVGRLRWLRTRVDARRRREAGKEGAGAPDPAARDGAAGEREFDCGVAGGGRGCWVCCGVVGWGEVSSLPEMGVRGVVCGIEEHGECGGRTNGVYSFLMR